ncbi:coiled-coil-helix-coiled-coil-helix domain-containing protein [Anaeramoeba ignava]|uniref:Coiled-coil-helix-coiled-coil-helix domain-containing protein n=1 Tax=Anaeramoeba ignava TaxID=1746090 RepID=A0A9Q0LRT1_ANAIG|nr:coiled-coil-helix-coiled-coil-helix domain-containing protein [Anaeramoeba ignava]
MEIREKDIEKVCIFEFTKLVSCMDKNKDQSKCLKEIKSLEKCRDNYVDTVFKLNSKCFEQLEKYMICLQKKKPEKCKNLLEILWECQKKK